MGQARKLLRRVFVDVFPKAAIYFAAAVAAWWFGFDPLGSGVIVAFFATLDRAHDRYKELLEEPEPEPEEDALRPAGERAEARLRTSGPPRDRRPIPWRPIVMAGLKTGGVVLLLVIILWALLVLRMRFGGGG